MGPPGRSMFIFIIIPKNATGRNKATQKTHTFCHNIKSAAGKSPPISRGAVRKRRREKGDFAVSRRQSALTTTKGACGAFPCASIKIARFLVQSSSAPGFWMKKAQRAAPQALLAAWGCRSACFMRQNPTAEPPFSYATLAFTQFFTASACISPAGWPPGWQGPPRPARSRSRRGCPRRERARSCPTGWTRWWAP